MGRNFGNYGLGLQTWEQVDASADPCFLKLNKQSSYKDGDYWYNGGDSASRKRYLGFLNDLQAEFIADGRTETRKRSSTGIVSGYISRGYNPNQGLACAYATTPNAKWYPPTYEDYLTVWNWYADQATRAGNYPDMRLVVQHFYEGRGPIVVVSATAVPTNVDEQAQQEAETTSRRGYQHRQRMRQRQRGTGTQGSFDVSAGPFSTGRDFMPGSGGASPGSSSSPQEVAISPDDVESEGMGLGLKIAIGLGVLGIGAFVARRQGWI